MRIIHVSHSNKFGGAATYVDRVINSHISLNIDNVLLASTLKDSSYRSHIISPSGQKNMNYIRAKLAQTADSKIKNLEMSQVHTYKSPNLIGAIKASDLNRDQGEIIHFYWINGGLISLRQIEKISKPIVWTMLDMWPFLGSEHYLTDLNNLRYVEGYKKSNKPVNSKGIDVCRIIWKLKIRHYNKFYLVSPSKWLAEEAKKSALFFEQHIEIIPPPIDANIFKPIDKSLARSLFGLKKENFIIGYLGGTSIRKGWNLIKDLCNHHDSNSNWQFLLGGASKESFIKDCKLKANINFIGRLDNNDQLVNFYSSIDVLLVPSIAEAYGLVAQEAQTMGIPVIVFENTGAEDIVVHGLSGLVCKERNVKSLKLAIENLCAVEESRKIINANISRQRAIEEWSFNTIGNKYLNLYEKIISQNT